MAFGQGSQLAHTVAALEDGKDDAEGDDVDLGKDVLSNSNVLALLGEVV
jgi:hypothetical protein